MRKTTITVRLPDGYKLEIENRAKKTGLKISDIVRQAIRKFLRIG